MEQNRTGGDFLLRTIGSDSIFHREMFTEDEMELVLAIKDFFDTNVSKELNLMCEPNQEHLIKAINDFHQNIETDQKLSPSEAKKVRENCFRKFFQAFHRPNIELIVKYLRQAGELGLLSMDIPAEYAGELLYEEDEVPQERLKDLFTEFIGKNEFAEALVVPIVCHRGIGTHPLLWFGTKEQKLKYLPGIAEGKILTAYALTEPGSGTDALSAKTTAVLNDAGTHFILNGTKQFITNAGFADLFTVFAQVDNKFTAFLVSKDMEGISTGPDEHKLGLHTSSTRQLILTDVKIPVKNTLGGFPDGVGKGMDMALITLTKGRRSLSSTCKGVGERCLNSIIRYTSERKQFGVSLDKMDAIQKKIADSVYTLFCLDSAIYRLDGIIDEQISTIPSEQTTQDYYTKIIGVHKTFTIEGSILKVLGSEALHKIANHAVQSYGGYGYSMEYEAAKFFADMRINEIWEGTNEINRQVISGFLFTAALMETLPFREAMEIVKKIATNNDKPEAEVHKDVYVAGLAVEYAKVLLIYCLDKIILKYGTKINAEHQIMEHIANIMGEIYLAESGILRANQCIENKDKHSGIKTLVANFSAAELSDKIRPWAKEILLNTVEPALWDKYVKKESQHLTSNMETTFDRIQMRRQIAEYVCLKGKYTL